MGTLPTRIGDDPPKRGGIVTIPAYKVFHHEQEAKIRSVFLGPMAEVKGGTLHLHLPIDSLDGVELASSVGVSSVHVSSMHWFELLS
jgi:hypothetical protein